METDEKADPKTKFEYRDFWGYHKYGDNSYYIESRNGDMLIGSGLPSTEEQAREYCRCANLAHWTAMELADKNMSAAIEALKKYTYMSKRFD